MTSYSNLPDPMGHSGPRYLRFTHPATGKKVRVYGGPFDQWDGKTFGVCLEAGSKLAGSANVLIPTPDFGVPNGADLMRGVLDAAEALEHEGAIYVGCRGGIGRTGMFMAALVGLLLPASNPVKYVRDQYLPYAVETSAQGKLVDRVTSLFLTSGVAGDRRHRRGLLGRWVARLGWGLQRWRGFRRVHGG